LKSATAQAFPNIAFIKYWGNRDNDLRLPANGSISMNLAGLTSTTRVTFDPALPDDGLTLNGQAVTGAGLQRAIGLLDRVRRMAGLGWRAEIHSENNFPTGAGIASSASGFAALAVAAACAAGLDLDERQLSTLARTASGSACRSIPGGFVEWLPGGDDESSYAQSIAPPDHWDLVDCIAVISVAHKATVSQDGHARADTSPLQAGRVGGAAKRVDVCRAAILQRDFEALAAVMELDSNLMHAVIMTSTPPILYWQPATLAVIHAVPAWRAQGLPACYTIDAGPNVHVICPAAYAGEISARLAQIPGIQRIITAAPGGPAGCGEHGGLEHS
jgi:diphosphomevalonate decarboxylase